MNEGVRHTISNAQSSRQRPLLVRASKKRKAPPAAQEGRAVVVGRHAAAALQVVQAAGRKGCTVGAALPRRDIGRQLGHLRSGHRIRAAQRSAQQQEVDQERTAQGGRAMHAAAVTAVRAGAPITQSAPTRTAHRRVDVGGS